MYTNDAVEAAVTSASEMITGDAMLAVGAIGSAVIAVVILMKIFSWIRRV